MCYKTDKILKKTLKKKQLLKKNIEKNTIDIAKKCRAVASSIIGGGGGAHVHRYVFTQHKNNRFQKKLIVQTGIYEYQPPPPQLSSLLRP